METTDMMSKQPATLSKYTSLGAAMAAKLMIGIWFGIGIILAVGIVDGLNYCTRALMSSGSK